MSTQAVQAPWRRDAGIIGLISACHASSHFSHLLLPLMFPFFVADLGLSYASLGGVISVFFAVSFCTQTGSGFVVDRHGARKVLYAAQGLMALACLWLSLASNLNDLLLGAVMLGIGNGAYHPVDYSVLNRQISPLRLGHAYSAHNLSGTLGWSLAPPFMIGLSSFGDWSFAYLGASGVYLTLLGLCIWRGRWLETRDGRVSAHLADSAAGPWSLWALLKLPAVVWSFVFLLCMTMTYSVVQNFLVTILQKVHELSLVSASMTLTAYLLLAATGNVLGGFLTSRWPASADRIVAWCMGLAGTWMLVSASAVLGAWGTPIALALTALAVGMGAPARDFMIKQATPAGATGRVYGLVFAGLDVGSAVSPLIFGRLMDQGWYGLTLAGAALFLWVGGRVSFALARQLASSSPHRSSGVQT
jgi:FSR family fosmidomycin resistance protein-like MFS transporter